MRDQDFQRGCGGSKERDLGFWSKVALWATKVLEKKRRTEVNTEPLGGEEVWSRGWYWAEGWPGRSSCCWEEDMVKRDKVDMDCLAGVEWMECGVLPTCLLPWAYICGMCVMMESGQA